MIENIKVDIIYFMTATDFEFEFNLGGCCRMRLLNDKVNEKKSFVNSLARAVSRSQIIIGVGPLFGEDGLIATTAAAISHSLQVVNNKAYGIASDEKIEVIEGAVPLVTGEGYFGGCIIESGNQSIILLTENRTVRKAIMKTLVHPYIEDMCIMMSAERTGSSIIQDVKPAVTEPEVSPEETPVTDGRVEEEAKEAEPQPAEETEPEAAEEAEPEVTKEAGEETENTDKAEPEPDAEHNVEIEFYEPDKEISEAEEEISGEIEQNPEEIYFMPEEEEEDDGEPQGKKKKGNGLNITILIVCILLLITVFAICYFLFFLPMIGGMSTSEYFKEIFSTASSV